MPFINVKIAGPTLAIEQICRLQRGLTDLISEAFHQERESTSVLVEQVPTGKWSIAGDIEPVLAHVTATVNAASHAADNKARFITEAHHLLKLILGDGLPSATYVVINELPDDSWGYGGITLEHRAKPAHLGSA